MQVAKAVLSALPLSYARAFTANRAAGFEPATSPFDGVCMLVPLGTADVVRVSVVRAASFY